MRDFFLSWGLIFIAAVFNSYASFTVKLRFNQLGEMDLRSLKRIVGYLFSFFKSPLIWSACLAFVLSPLFWFAALDRIDLSLATPVQFSMHLIAVLTLSTLFLREKINYQKVIGVICIAISLYFLYKS